MSTRVYEAIISRWDSQSLGDTFTGGIWFEVAPAGTDYPFVVLTSLGNVPTLWTSDNEYREQNVQMSIFYEKTTGTDPVSALGSLMRTLDDAMLFAPLSIAASAGNIYDVRRMRDDLRKDPEPNIWQGIIDYRIMRTKTATYSPS